MYEDIYPEEEIEVEIMKDGSIRKKINLMPKGQTIGKPSKKAKATMKRAMAIRRYIKKGEKDKE